MNEKTERIFGQYEDIVLENLRRYANGEEIDAEAMQVLNDCIRIL